MDAIDLAIERLKAYQACPWVHNLTCGVDSRHDLLVPTREDDKIVLLCPSCSYRQENVPGFAYVDLEAMRPQWG